MGTGALCTGTTASTDDSGQRGRISTFFVEVGADLYVKGLKVKFSLRIQGYCRHSRQCPRGGTNVSIDHI